MIMNHKTAAAVLGCLVLSGCTTSTVVTGEGDDCGLSRMTQKEKQPTSVADLAVCGDYALAEQFARANIYGGKNPIVRRKILKGSGASNQAHAAEIPPSPMSDIAMHRLDLCSVLLLEGKKAEAHAELLKVESEVEELFDPDSQALKLTHGEREKFFRGDGYERATLYAFLALSFLERGEYGEAIKRVKRGIAADSDAEKGEYRADYALLPYIGYVAARKAGNDSEAAGFDEKVFLQCGFRPSQMEMPEALLLVWTGGGTSRELGGEFDEIRYIRKGATCCALDSASVEFGGRTFPSLPDLADFNFQAATRGKRMMDYVLEDKAKVKRGLAASGNALLAFGAACFTAAGTSGNPVMMPILGAVGGLSVALGGPTHLVGMMINASADDRYWSVLPGRLLVIPVAGRNATFTLKGYCGWDEVYRSEYRSEIPPQSASIPVMHLSLMKESYTMHEYKNEKFIKTGDAAVTAVREGWNKAEIKK